MKNLVSARSIAAFIFLSACSGGNGDNVTSVIPSVAVGPTAPAMPVERPRPTALGRTGWIDGVLFTIKSVELTTQVGEYGLGPKVQPGETFVIVRYEMKNVSRSPIDDSERPTISLIDPIGQAYIQNTEASGESKGDESPYEDLNPNISTKSSAAWKVEKAAFDKATWAVAVGGDRQVRFALQ